MFFRPHLPWQWAHSSLQLLIQPWIHATGTHYGWVDRFSVEYEVCYIWPALEHPIYLAACSYWLTALLDHWPVHKLHSKSKLLITTKVIINHFPLFLYPSFVLKVCKRLFYCQTVLFLSLSSLDSYF